MDVTVGRLPLGHLQGGDAQAPDVLISFIIVLSKSYWHSITMLNVKKYSYRHTVVANLLDHLRSHPVRSSWYIVTFSSSNSGGNLGLHLRIRLSATDL